MGSSPLPIIPDKLPYCFSISTSTILINCTTASKREPKAIEPQWYLLALEMLVNSGSAGSTITDLKLLCSIFYEKYQMQHVLATTK